jgi:NAD(P)-dependent dehydrogenase (short-subunit alcohol dehydrogenase family)
MKIAVTGHTAGIGLAIVNLLKKDHKITGFSRTNGYHLKDVDNIVSAAESVDVFVNNAYYKYQQCEILKQLAHRWQGTNKHIINVGSTCINYPRIESELDSDPWEYRDHKTALEKMFRKLAKQPNACTISLINPGAVDTDMIQHLTVPKLSPEDVAQATDLLIKNKKIKELTLWL